MQKHKYRILGVIAILSVLVISIIIFPQAYAVESETETTTELTCLDLEYKYGLHIEKSTEGDNKYIVRRDAGYMGNCDTEEDKTEQKDATLKITKINGVSVDGALIPYEGNATIEANLQNCTNTETGQGTKCISVELTKTLSTADESLTGADILDLSEVVEVKYEIEDESSERASLMAANPDYGTGICAEIVNYANSIGTEGYTFVKNSIGYCFEPQVIKGLDYTDDELRQKFDSVKTYWDIFSTPTSNDTGTFAATFADIKTKAVNAGNVGTVGVDDKVDATSYSGSLKCSYKIKSNYTNKYGETIDLTTPIVDSSIDEQYYREHDYFYASKTTDVGSVTYTYNYAIGNTVTETKAACERTCEEAVKVEYGMPVASKAGLCFEYRVKVTSYVKCSTTPKVSPPTNTTGQYCNPAPKCTSTSGILRKIPQAGPTEEFDTCVNKCDGGKYTEECSLKCYEQVYGNSLNTKLTLNYEDMQATKLAVSASEIKNCLANNNGYYGCYSCEKNGASGTRCSSINWYADINYDANGNQNATIDYNNVDGLGRWYLDRVYRNGKGSPNYDYNSGGFKITGLFEATGDSAYGTRYVADANGFYRRNYSGGLCTDLCVWKTDTCGANEYLNPGSAIADYKANMQEYENGIAACSAAATCTSKTAEFTISVDYETSETKITEVFPTTTNKDKISSKGTGSANTNTGSCIKTGANGCNTSILDYAGCYNAETEKNWYMTEWGFPGTYIHNKTGEISYEKPSDLSGYYYENKKFCTPLNALSINSKWVEYAELPECWHTLGDSDITYNIEAKTTNFGYFGWDFDISCFYGLRNEACQVDEDTQCCKDPPGGGGGGDDDGGNEDSILNYRIRSVDLDNLFPNSTATENAREIGFNWTNDASISANKNAAYQVQPGELALRIQNEADTLYSNDAELDYYFELTPENLSKIRNYNKTHEYDDYSGSVETVNGVNAYRSNLFSDTYFEDYQRNAEIGCNNGTC